MKKTHIIGIIIIAVAIGSMMAMLGSSTTYANFAEAASTYKGSEVHVIGKLDRNKPFEYDAAKDANRFVFYMIDEKNTERRVVLLDAKPTDFERSQQVVAIGKMQGEEFVATGINMKCPSKYNDGREQAATATADNK